uniref:SGNH hydrolase-type esterase domain-containing protein n=1 Tax=Anas platyrhynchos platyrhynchos TaxID=8840 RepID=A0A493TN05_ANAPP
MSQQGVEAGPVERMRNRGPDCPQETRGWTLVLAQSRKGRLPPTPTVPPTTTVSLGNRFEALREVAEEAEGLDSSVNPGNNPEKRVKTEGSAEHKDQGWMEHRIVTGATKKEQRVLVIGDSLLRGTEAPICRPDNLSREVCCLPGGRVRDLRKALPQLIKLDDYCPLVVIQVGSQEVAIRKMKNIKKYFASLGRMLRGSGVQVVISSVLPLGEWDADRRSRTGQVNDGLRGWCLDQGFGYFDLLDLVLTNRDGLVRDVKVGGSLGCSDHEMVEFQMELGKGSKAKSRIATLDFRRANFDLFQDLLGSISWDRMLEDKGACESWATFKQHFFPGKRPVEGHKDDTGPGASSS